MITGYNHNVIHRDRVYHIQTEDSGTKYPHIITHLFVGGNILSSKKKSYAHLLEQELHEEELEKAVRAIMREQHKDMLRELKSGKHDDLSPGRADSHEATDAVVESPSELEGVPTPPSPAPLSVAKAEEQTSAPAKPPLPLSPSPAPLDEDKEAPTGASETPSSEGRTGADAATQSIRGAARINRRRSARERPSFQPPSATRPSPPSMPTTVMSALKSIEIGSSEQLDQLLFDDDMPTIPDLPSASTPAGALEGEAGDGSDPGFSTRGMERARGIRGRGGRSLRSLERQERPDTPQAPSPAPSPGTQEASASRSSQDTDDKDNHYPAETSPSGSRFRKAYTTENGKRVPSWPSLSSPDSDAPSSRERTTTPDHKSDHNEPVG